MRTARTLLAVPRRTTIPSSRVRMRRAVTSGGPVGSGGRCAQAGSPACAHRPPDPTGPPLVTALRILTLLLGIVVLLGTANSVLAVLIVPRPATSLALYPVLIVRGTFRKMAQLTRTYPA